MAEEMTTSETAPFPAVIGQIEQRQLMARIISTGRLAHAYLFVGPEGSGKRTLAIEMARVLNCPKGVETSLGGCDCHSCTSMMKWRHPNLWTIFPLPALKLGEKEEGKASDEVHNLLLSQLAIDAYTPLRYERTGKILIDHVREARKKVSFAQGLSGIRVLFIHPADAMNEQSSNALLKLLEEPPEKCLLILTTESTRDVLPTILSRCQQVHLTPLPRGDITEALILAKSIEPTRASTIAALSNGSYTQALEWLGEKTEEIASDGLEFLRSVATGNVGKITELIEKWAAEDATRSELKGRLDITSLWILDALTVLGASDGSPQVPLRIHGSGQNVARMAERYGASRLIEILGELEEAKLAIDTNAMQTLVLTTLSIKLKRIFQS